MNFGAVCVSSVSIGGLNEFLAHPDMLNPAAEKAAGFTGEHVSVLFVKPDGLVAGVQDHRGRATLDGFFLESAEDSGAPVE